MMYTVVQVGFLQPVYPVNESDGRVSVCIIFSGQTEREVTVEIFKIGVIGIILKLAKYVIHARLNTSITIHFMYKHFFLFRRGIEYHHKSCSVSTWFN